MKRLLLIYLTICIALTIQAQQSIMVKKGDAQSLLDAIQQANTTNADTNAQWFYILIPDGLYDLGERVLTPIKGHHIALIGQSMTGTIVRNAPDRKIEGISKTAVFKNTGSNNYFQDMTIQNALDYYCGCCHIRTLIIQTTKIASTTSKTRRYTVRWTLSVVPVMCGLKAVVLLQRSVPSRARDVV